MYKMRHLDMSQYRLYMVAMQDGQLTLEELSERSGVEQRTLRSWVSEGLLSPPLKPGRGARYPASNADRALAIRALKDIYGLSLAEIGRRFLMATSDQIQAWASEIGQAATPAGSARDYLKKIRVRMQATGAAPEVSAPSQVALPRPTPPTTNALALLKSRSERAHPHAVASGVAADRNRIEALILALEGLLSAPAARRSQSSIWTRIGITADLELSVRGDLSPSERHLFEQLADQLRAILVGRSKHD